MKHTYCTRTCPQCGHEFRTHHPEQRCCGRACAHSGAQRPRAIKNTPERFWSLLDKSGECWLWTGGLGRGSYGRWAFRGRTTAAHRIAWALTHGPVPEGLDVLHKCDVRLCCRPEHLFLGTTLDNMRDKVAKGRQVRGDDHWSRKNPEKVRRGEASNKAKLTEELVRELRTRYVAGGISQSALARAYGLNRTTVQRVLYGETWAHI